MIGTKPVASDTTYPHHIAGNLREEDSCTLRLCWQIEQHEQPEETKRYLQTIDMYITTIQTFTTWNLSCWYIYERNIVYIYI